MSPPVRVSGEHSGTVLNSILGIAATTPDAIALLTPQGSLTYAQLVQRIASLVDRLHTELATVAEHPANAVLDPPCVAIHYPPSEQLVVGILGVMACGACCVPIAANAPAERIDSLLADARPLLLISPVASESQSGRGSNAIPRLDLATLLPSATNEPATFTPHAQATAPAVALYTSGTTGKPKAVLMTHQSFANLAEVHGLAFSLSKGSRALIFGSPAHGNWINSLLAALANGAIAVVEPEKRLLPGPDLLHVLKSKQITHVHMPPTSLAALPLTELPALRVLTLGGEALVVESIAPWLDQARLYNCYGATESNWLAFSEITRASLIQLTIGRAITGMQAEVVNTNLQPVPQGEVGELIMSGVGLALGYLNDPKLTHEKFVTVKSLGDNTWYRSGDLARALGDGQYEIVGRNDAQLSIRGFRVEPGETEAALIKHEAIAQAAVYGRQTQPGSTQLVAMLSLVPDSTLSVEQLRDWLAKSLPHYMIPARFQIVEKLPLLANGKLDRSALTTLPSQSLSSNGGHHAPVTDHELAIASYWSEYTDEPAPYLDNDFFVDGGDSLRAVKLLWDLSHEFGIDLRASDFLLQPTLEALAKTTQRAISSSNKEAKARTGAFPPMIESAPLTPTQERLWSISRYSSEPALYNVPYLLELNGAVRADIIELGMRQIITRHLPLRSTISVESGMPVQRVTNLQPFELAPFHLTRLDFSAIEITEAETKAQQAVDHEANRPFDLSAELTPRVTLITIAPDRQQLLFVLHHVVCDGWSVANLFRELSQIYNSALSNTTSSTAFESLSTLDNHTHPVLATTYFDFAQRYANEGPSQASLDYWEHQLLGAPTRIQLPLDYSYPHQEDYAGATQRIALGPELLERVEQYAVAHAVTASAVFLSAYFILLNRIGAGDDLTVGVPLIGHEHADTQNLIGLFASVVPIRIQLSPDCAISELVTSVHQTLHMAIAHQSLPGGSSVTPLEGPTLRSPARLLQTVFSHQNVLSTEDVDFRDMDACVKPVFPKTAKFELLLNVEKLGDESFLLAEYRTALFATDTVARLLSNYNAVLQALTRPERQTLADVYPLPIPLPTPLAVSSKTPGPAANLPNARIDTHFERQCSDNPDAIALIEGAQKFTYQVINDEAGRFAKGLLALGVSQGGVIGLCSQRSRRTAVAMLGVLKAGCAYMPLPPEYPAERLKHMIESSGADLIVYHEEGPAIRNTDIQAISYSAVLSSTEIGASSTPEPSRSTGSSTKEIAYVMYTSGTSGTPNPVAVPHSGVVRLAKNPDYVALSKATVTLQLAPLAFDASTFELWGAWLNGGCCVISADEATNLGRLEETIARNKVNTLWLTSSLFNAIVDENPRVLRGVDQLLVGGEALSVPHIARAQTALPDVTLINGYGPTECTTFACTYRIPASFDPRILRVPIGRAIQHTSAWVLDEARRPVRSGLLGELYLGGDGVAIGYLKNRALTDARFVHVEIAGQEVRLYKTGDLVIEQADGNLQFMGRADQQVKIRGFRIEPQQIERVLQDDPQIGRAAVVVQRIKTATTLLAVIETTTSASISSIKTRASSKLSQHERPTNYYLIDKLPTTENGKIDRNALETFVKRQGSVPSTQETISTNQRLDPTEAWLITLWKELLNTPHVQSTDNFFDLGGNSLLAIRCMERIRQTFKVELPLSILFEAGSAQELAELLRVSGKQQHEWSSLVTIRTAANPDTAVNLFLVHAIGGEVLGFAEFAAHLDDNLSVYALQARGALENQDPHDNLTEMAACYIKEIQRVQPTGPYRLGGLSMGGLIAHEMAVQLAKAGHIVDYLLIGDTWFFSGRKLDLVSRLRYTVKVLGSTPYGVGVASTRYIPRTCFSVPSGSPRSRKVER